MVNNTQTCSPRTTAQRDGADHLASWQRVSPLSKLSRHLFASEPFKAVKLQCSVRIPFSVTLNLTIPSIILSFISEVIPHALVCSTTSIRLTYTCFGCTRTLQTCTQEISPMLNLRCFQLSKPRELVSLWPECLYAVKLHRMTAHSSGSLFLHVLHLARHLRKLCCYAALGTNQEAF